MRRRATRPSHSLSACHGVVILTRIKKRGVKLSPNDLTRLGRAVDRMQEKGVRDALIYINHAVALIVSVANRTVITAVDEASAKENIFTNIDSAAIL